MAEGLKGTRILTYEDVALLADMELAIGAVDERMLILVDIEKLLSGAEIGLGGPTLQ